MGLSNRMNCNQCEKELVQENCLICSACRQAVYCSRQCQKLNWKIHKSKCKQLRPDGNKEHSCDDCNSLNLKMKNLSSNAATRKNGIHFLKEFLEKLSSHCKI